MELTFDDGPDDWTEAILDLLSDHGVTATFFLIGEKVAARAETVQRIHREGHRIGNHSWSHPKLTQLESEAIEGEVTATQKAIARACDVRPTAFRPPYGDTDDRVRQVVEAMGFEHLLWDVDPQDWSQPGVDVILRAIEGAEAGDVVLLHDGGGDRSQTHDALARYLADRSRTAFTDDPP